MHDFAVAFDNIDRLQTLEIQGPALPYGIKAKLFEAARAAHDRPLVLAAAELLDRPSCRVGIVTGAQVPEKMPVGENDGPLGSLVLAEALGRIGHEVSFYTDTAAAGPIEALAAWRGLDCPVVRLEPGSDDEQRSIAAGLDVAVAVERLGGNPNGIIYGATGVSRSGFRCNTDALFREMMALGKPTVGVADGGNEIGCGKIHAVIAETLADLNFTDRTPCGGGVFSVVPTDVLVIGTSSNLACAGVVAALALLRVDAELCHTAAAELALIEKGVALGLTDGGTGRVIAAVDGVPATDHAAAVGLMQAIVRRTLAAPLDRGF